MRVLPVIFAVLIFGMGEMRSRAATFLVQMSNYSFTPRDITVDVGDTIIWTNTVITGHNAVAEGVWASPLLPRRGTFSFTFNIAPGLYNYVCTPHVSFGMLGTVTVRAAVNTPPTAVINSPQNGQTFFVGDPINVDVTATDTGGVAQVELFVDGALAQTDATSPYQFSVNNLPAGPHTLLARATDGGGLTAESSVAVNVQFANAAPTVTLTSPTNTSKFTEPAVVVFAASATGSLDRVEFLTNGVVMASDATAPYSVTNTLTRGAYTVVARAVATDTQIGTSDAALIEVGEHVPEPPQVLIVSPLEGQYVSFASNIVLRAQATDADSPISQVEFATSSEILGTVFSPNPFELMTFLPEGTNTVFARATDSTGLSSTSAPVTFFVQMPATNTYRTNIAPGIVRLGFFGSSGLPYVFEFSTDITSWTPFRTNQFYRRIFFFDAGSPTNEPMRFYRARSPLVIPTRVARTNALPSGGSPPIPTL